MKSKGWECPKCGRVYAPTCMECSKCNSTLRDAIREMQGTPSRPVQSREAIIRRPSDD